MNFFLSLSNFSQDLNWTHHLFYLDDSTKLICWSMSICIAKCVEQIDPLSGAADRPDRMLTNVNVEPLHAK